MNVTAGLPLVFGVYLITALADPGVSLGQLFLGNVWLNGAFWALMCPLFGACRGENRDKTVLDLSLRCTKLVCFCYKFISLMSDDSLKGKAVVKIEMQYGILKTDAKF